MSSIADSRGTREGTPPGKRKFSERERESIRRGFERRAWLLTRLQRADGPAYDTLIAELFEATANPNERRSLESARSVRAVRSLFANGLATTENDESVWLTARGWQADQTEYATRGIRNNQPKIVVQS